MLLTASNIEKLLELVALLGTKAIPWIIKTCEDIGYVPSPDQIKSRWETTGKDPDDYFTVVESPQTFTCPELPKPVPVITYFIVSDEENQLKNAAKLSCNFWNYHILPNTNIVVRLSVFTEDSYTIARAYEPYQLDNTLYGRVQYNTKWLGHYTPDGHTEIISHEIGHTLGIGFHLWDSLYHHDTGKMKCFEDTWVELEGGLGTALSHFDEERYGSELMTGWQDQGECYVMPQTIEVMKYLEHTVSNRLDCNWPFKDFVKKAGEVQFSRMSDVESINLSHFEETPLIEERYHRGK